MTKDELLAKFDPVNAVNLTEADLEQMRKLTDEQIGELAKAFPNQANRKAYLVLYDKNLDPKKQLYPLSTWQNLNNVRKFANRKNLVPHTFRSIFETSTTRPQTSTAQQRNTAPARKVTVDLSAQDAAKELKEAVEKRPVTTSARKPEQPKAAATDTTNAAATDKTADNNADKKVETKKVTAAAPKKSAAKKPAAVPEKTLPAQGDNTPADQEFSSGTD